MYSTSCPTIWILISNSRSNPAATPTVGTVHPTWLRLRISLRSFSDVSLWFRGLRWLLQDPVHPMQAEAGRVHVSGAASCSDLIRNARMIHLILTTYLHTSYLPNSLSFESTLTVAFCELLCANGYVGTEYIAQF